MRGHGMEVLEDNTLVVWAGTCGEDSGRLGRKVELPVMLQNAGYKSKGNKPSVGLQHMEQLGLVWFFLALTHFFLDMSVLK